MNTYPSSEFHLAHYNEEEHEMGISLTLDWNDSVVRQFITKQRQLLEIRCPIGPFEPTLTGIEEFQLAILKYLADKVPGCWIHSKAVLVCPNSWALSKIIMQVMILSDEPWIGAVLGVGEPLLAKLTKVSCMCRGMPRTLDIPNSVLFE